MAKRFVFRLEPVLTVRKHHEQQQQRVVAELERSMQEGLAYQGELHQWSADASAAARSMRQQSRLDVAAALQEQRFQWSLERRLDAGAARVANVQRDLQAARSELAGRAAQRKAIEKLKKRRLEAHETETDRQDRVAEDEMATQMYLRQLQGTPADAPHGKRVI